ncbi:MAG TPA: hypothetical protein VK675_02270 [Candidatus Paceibacterota bacterium]|nr:hypothetical protein [Candidatus Paceibacterota bacterium]
MKKDFNAPLLLGVIAILVIGSIAYVFQNKEREESVIDTQTLTNTKTSPTVADRNKPKPILASNPTLSNDCKEFVSFSPKAYQDGWEMIFKRENNLSDTEFSNFITVSAVALRLRGITCELNVRYTIKKEWIVEKDRVDKINLGGTPSVKPAELPLERDPAVSGGYGVSTVNLHSTLFFKSKTDALNYYVDAYNLKGTNAEISGEGFQYFWGKENAEKSGYPFPGEGGEEFITISGAINQRENKCYHGALSLSSRKTMYSNSPCSIN